jgi:hypothetical protein
MDIEPVAPLIAAVSSASAFTWFGGVKGALQFDLGMFAGSIVGSIVFAAVGMYTLLRRASCAKKRLKADWQIRCAPLPTA